MQKRQKNIKLPGIGMRIIKSAFAAAICMLVNSLRGDAGIVFYSQLAALWCIQTYQNNTVKNAIQRIIGTFVGAFYGLLYLLLAPLVSIEIGDSIWKDQLCIFISIVVVLYSTVLIRAKQASYFSCVVFLSIVINHINDANPYMFVLNRVLDTLIGIAIGITVNNIRLCQTPDRETLFVSGVDDILLDRQERMSAFSKVELNRMIDDGMKFTIATMRTPASLMLPLLDINLKYPVIAIDGAVLYDTGKNEYIKTYVMSRETSRDIYSLIIAEKLNIYTNVIIDDTLIIYYQDTKDYANRNLVEKLKTSPFRNYIKREYTGEENVVYFMILDLSERVKAFYEKLSGLGYDKKLKILCYESEDYEGYSYIKIFNKNATKENMLSYLVEKYNIERHVSFGTVSGKYDVTLEENNLNEMVRVVRRMYEPIMGIRKKNG